MMTLPRERVLSWLIVTTADQLLIRNIPISCALTHQSIDCNVLGSFIQGSALRIE